MEVKLRIRDQEYMVKSDGSEEEILRIADYVNAKIQEASSEGLSEKKTAVLAALHIASDYFQALKEKDEAFARNRRQTEALIDHIDSVIGRNLQPNPVRRIEKSDSVNGIMKG
ncbi:MAG: cell division protein ZapA [Desulfobacteraceae bacterium]|nr:MAG: cell division protein ZapA [Desulfobacteraceae bacterium]